MKASACLCPPLTSSPNKLAAPAPFDSTITSDQQPPTPDSHPPSLLTGATCCVSPGRDHDDDCAKKLTEPLWASEDLAKGASEWSEIDTKRASSLDATECLEGVALDASLIRSSALEDLTAIDQAQKVDTESDQPGQRTQSLSDAGYVSERVDQDDVSAQLQCDPPTTVIENSSDDKERYSNPDFSNDSETEALESGEARLASPARKSMVPVAVSKGLLEVLYSIRAWSCSRSSIFGFGFFVT